MLEIVAPQTEGRMPMYALFAEVNADESHVEQARETLPKVAVPRAKEMGATAGYWLAAAGGRGVSVVLFDTEDAARAAAAPLKVGDEVGPIPGVTWKTVEVREVLAQL
jgi:hypothetical protein